MREFNFAEGEVLLVDKPLTWTSFDVVKKIKNAIGVKKLKIGHAGTLDPLATGLLILCTGKMTKKIESFQAQEKTYTGTFTLGGTTPSIDLESEIDQTFPISHLTDEILQEGIKRFIGEIDQIPPKFSAVKVNGQRAYKAARKGEEVEIRSRQITINSFHLTRIELPEVDFKVCCSKGTYIRSLARDYGEAVGSGAHLTALRRTHIGEYDVSNAYSMDDLLSHIKQ